jgi:mRNA interferase HigB
MVIISKSILRSFGSRYPDATVALNQWYAMARDADWSSLNDVRKTFNSVDYVGNDHFVFNIRGNRYRLVVMIFFNIRTIYIRFIGTHDHYNNIDASTI